MHLPDLNLLNQYPMRRVRESLMVGIFLLLASCEGGTAYHVYHSLPADGWRKQDTLVYTLPRQEVPAGIYRLEIGMRNIPSYPYRDLWLVWMHNGNDTLVFQKDTLHLYLADSMGHWYGENQTATLYSHVYAVCDSFIVHQNAQQHEIRIVNIMRDNPLKGISDVGIRLIDIKAKH